MNEVAVITSIDEFVDAVLGSINNLSRAGKYAAEESAKDPNWTTRVCELRPQLTESFLDGLIKVGLNQWVGEFFLSESPGARAIRCLPFSVQSHYVKRPIELVVKRDGGYDTKLVDVRDLSSNQAKQVFSKGSIRSARAQEAYIEDRLLKSSVPKVEDGSYKVSGGQLVVTKPCRITRSEVVRLMQLM